MKKIKFLLIAITFSYSQTIDYNSEIQPIFDIHCTDCHVHGGSATLNLSSYDGLMNGGVSGQALVEGDHINSLIYVRITLPVGTDGSMPPNNPLSQSEIDLIAQWIDEGAFLLSDKKNISPQKFKLHQNYPNPFNPMTSISYYLPVQGLVNITIYDMMSRIVKTLVNAPQTAGHKSIQWNATNNRNEPVSAGLYIYTIQANEFRQAKKMVLIK